MTSSATSAGLRLEVSAFCPSANVGDSQAYFEPIHGSAPSLAGRDLANPIATVLSAGLMLDRLGEHEAAVSISRAVEEALVDGVIAVRPDGTLTGGTRAAATQLSERVRRVQQ